MSYNAVSELEDIHFCKLVYLFDTIYEVLIDTLLVFYI